MLTGNNCSFNVVCVIVRQRNQLTTAISHAIRVAQLQEKDEVGPDQLLLGCLLALARFGIVKLGPWIIDLEALGVEWLRVDWLGEGKSEGPKVAYSTTAVALLDRTALIARHDDSAELGLEHMLVAFAGEDIGLMGDLKRKIGFESAAWRAAAAQLKEANVTKAEAALAEDAHVGQGPRDYLSPEQAAEELGIHVQTLRTYVRSGKLPAFRLAGERSIRIRRADLHKVLEPLASEKTTAQRRE